MAFYYIYSKYYVPQSNFFVTICLCFWPVWYLKMLALTPAASSSSGELNARARENTEEKGRHLAV